MALSITHFPRKRTTYAVFYGCSTAAMREISGRMANAEDSLSHPLILVGIFAEIERKRQISLVIKGLEALLRTVASLSVRGAEWTNVAPREDEAEHAIDPWLEIHYLKNGLENWKEQLRKMVMHADELAGDRDPDYGLMMVDQSDPRSVHEREYREMVRKAGKRINERLQEIICDYDEKIRECVMIMDGMTLATQLVSASRSFYSMLRDRLTGHRLTQKRTWILPS